MAGGDAPAALPRKSFHETVRAYLEPRIAIMVLLGFSAGLPFLLSGSTLSAWLTDSGIDRATVVYLTWVGLAYTFKFLWSPIVDRVRFPFFARRFGHRRSWMLLAQIAIAIGLVLMLNADPGTDLAQVVFAALLVAVASATQDIALDAWRIEISTPEQQGLMSAAYQLGYRIALIVAGAGAFYMADLFSWKAAYGTMAALAGVGIAATLFAPEPTQGVRMSVAALVNRAGEPARASRMLALAPVLLGWVFAIYAIVTLMRDPASGVLWLGPFAVNALYVGPVVLGAVVGIPLLTAYLLVGQAARQTQAPSVPSGTFANVCDWLYAAILAPLVDFVRRYWFRGLLILGVILTYRLTDIVMGKVANPFYLEMGYTKSEIASVSKIYGVWVTIAGAALAGAAIYRFGMVRPLIAGAIVGALSNLAFAWVALQTKALWALTLAITVENLAGGLAGTALVAYMSQFASSGYTATQYAFFSSLFTLPGNLLGGFAGKAVTDLAEVSGGLAQGYAVFFTATALMGIPAILLCLLLLAVRVDPVTATPREDPKPSRSID